MTTTGGRRGGLCASAIIALLAISISAPTFSAEGETSATQPSPPKTEAPSNGSPGNGPPAPASQESEKDKPVGAETPTVEVVGYNLSVSSADAASQGSVTGDYIDLRPVLRPGEVLEYVPGMVVTQHSGDGKANQYFLRGFNLDHGTDFATTVDGVPVNMPTHAHGQGYMDLNFLIPELIQRMDFQKGPYYAAYGDFSVAGAADIYYYPRLEEVPISTPVPWLQLPRPWVRAQLPRRINHPHSGTLLLP